jgi:hypothetical protein
MAAADLMVRGRADGAAAGAVASPARKTRTPRMSLRRSSSGGRDCGRSMGSRGAAGSTRRTTVLRGERPARTPLRWWRRRSCRLMPGRAVMPSPLFLPRAHGVASLRAVVAPASRNQPLDRTVRARAGCDPQRCLFILACRRETRSGGAPSGEAQESIEQWGSATNRRCDGLPSGTRPRSRAG